MTDYEYIDHRFARLTEHINRLEKENILLSDRIERLESIIIAMSQHGNETTYPNQGELHTHCYYPLNGARELVKDIEMERWAEADAAQDTHEQQMDEEAMRCPRCGDSTHFMSAVAGGDLCPECVSELAQEQVYLDHADMEIEEPPDVDTPHEAW